MDDIDRLVDGQMERGQRHTPQETCPNCGAVWHGKPLPSCPGSHFTPRFKVSRRAR